MHSVLNSAGSFRHFQVPSLLVGFLSLSLCAAAVAVTLLPLSMGCAGSKTAKDDDPADKAKPEDVDLSASRPATPTTASQMADSAPAPRTNNDNTLRCSYCYDDLDGDDAQFLKPCIACRNKVCGACIGKQFTMACRDMSDMPPRCCTMPFNLALAVPYLSDDEVAAFKVRHEEWRTVSPVYCPVPTCAAFIPYRFFPVEKRATWDRISRDLGLEMLEESMAFYGRMVREIDSTELPPELGEVDTATRLESIASIACPACTAQVCCDCKQGAHPGSPCSQSNLDIDPELEETLRMLNVKRCPKCHAGVRRMFGCSHILCRCGCQWCWQCNKYIEECDRMGCRDDDEYDPSDDEGAYDYDDEDESPPENNNDADENNANRDTDNPPETQPVAATEKGQTENPPRDLDGGGRGRWDDTDRFDFGAEGDRGRVDPWDCGHHWELQAESVDESARLCEHCWREVFPQSLPYPDAARLLETGSFHALDTNDENDTGLPPKEGYFSCRLCRWILCDHCLGGLGYTAIGA